MDLNTILRLLVTISCFSLIVRVIVSRNHWGWLGVSIGILGVMGIALYWIPEQAGIIGGILWLILILIPLIGLRQVNRLVYQEQFQKARRLASILSWLHPADGWRERPRFLKVLELTKKGEIKTAKTQLSPYVRSPQHSFDYTAKALQFRLECRWEECLHWLQTDISHALLWQNSTLVTVYLRALGEVGDVNGLIWTVKSHQSQINRLGDSILINLARLYVFAFSGEVQEVKKLFASTLKIYPQNVQTFWLATAEMALGNQENGHRLLLSIQEKDVSLESAIAQRFSQPIPQADQILTVTSQRILHTIKQDLQQEINYGSAISITPTKAYFTYSLMVANVLVFLLEMQAGGTQNLETLYRLGAAVPVEIFSGEPWRILTANFLHYGYIHIGSNLLGLWILGPYVEFYLGWIRYLIVYFISGLGAISLFAVFAMFLGEGDELLVGASAAIMGLMGATFMILWRGWRQEQSTIAQERLRLVILIISLQIMFDVSLAKVSFIGHFCGLIFGIFSTFIILAINKNKMGIVNNNLK